MIVMNKLVDQYNNTYHHPIGKKPIDAIFYLLFGCLRANSEPLSKEQLH